MQPVPWRHSHPHNMRHAFYHYFFSHFLSSIVEDYALMMMCGNSTLLDLTTFGAGRTVSALEFWWERGGRGF